MYITQMLPEANRTSKLQGEKLSFSSQYLLKNLSGTGKVPWEEYQQSPRVLSDYKTANKHM